MATLKTANGHGRYFDNAAKQDVINYIMDESKTPSRFIGGVRVDVNDIAGSMAAISERYGKSSGVQLRHFIISFSPGEVRNMDTVNEIAKEAVLFLGREYQTVYAVHEDTDHPHIHIVTNSVSYVDGHRYYGTRKEFKSFMGALSGIMRRHGIASLTYSSNR